MGLERRASTAGGNGGDVRGGEKTVARCEHSDRPGEVDCRAG